MHVGCLSVKALNVPRVIVVYTSPAGGKKRDFLAVNIHGKLRNSTGCCYCKTCFNMFLEQGVTVTREDVTMHDATVHDAQRGSADIEHDDRMDQH